jgi:hypothetical protein
MPTLTCPSCSATLRAPAQAAGKKVRCPKCSTAVPVAEADFEVVDDEPTPAKPIVARAVPKPVAEPARPQKKSRDDEDDDDRPSRKSRRYDDDEDDDYEDRTRRRAKKQAKKPDKNFGLRLALILGFGVLAIMVAVGYLVVSSLESRQLQPPIQKKLEVAAPQQAAAPQQLQAPPQLPAGWITFTDPAGAFSVAMPETPVMLDDVNQTQWQLLKPGVGNFSAGTIKKNFGDLSKIGNREFNSLADVIVSMYSHFLGGELSRQMIAINGRNAIRVNFVRGDAQSVLVIVVSGQKVHAFWATLTRNTDVFARSIQILN